ncbi:hypothetical protein ONZ45_g19498 [Pleurotus djamor]|nr:hypothetical protein ONZ45_g19498 [Pleurotus djamor]
MDSPRRLTFFLLALALASPALAEKICPDPYEDPSTDYCNPLRYIPSNALTGIAFTVFLLVAFAQTWLTWKVGAKYMMAMVIGCYTFTLGFAIRFGSPSNPQSLGTYIGQHTLIVLSPCAFIAATYVLLGRLALYIDRNKHLPIRPTIISTLFVTSDVFTFLIQASGGGLSASAGQDVERAEMGANIFFGGLIVQLISFVIFMVLLYTYLYRIYKHEQAIWNIHSHRVWYRDWRSLAGAQCVSSIGILVSQIF